MTSWYINWLISGTFHATREFITSKNKRKHRFHCFCIASERRIAFERCGQIAASSILCISLLLKWLGLCMAMVMSGFEGQRWYEWLATTHRRQSYANLWPNVQNGSHVLKTQKVLAAAAAAEFLSHTGFTQGANIHALNGANRNRSSCIKLHSFFQRVFYGFIFIYFLHLTVIFCIFISSLWQYWKRREEMKVKTCKCFPLLHAHLQQKRNEMKFFQCKNVQVFSFFIWKTNWRVLKNVSLLQMTWHRVFSWFFLLLFYFFFDSLRVKQSRAEQKTNKI